MKELFKWMAAHPDAKLELGFVERVLYSNGSLRSGPGYVSVEVRSRWGSRAKCIINVDHIDLLVDENGIISYLNEAYRKCADERFKCFDGIREYE